MENFTKDNKVVDLKLPAALLGFFVLFIISLFIVHIQVSINEFEIDSCLVALFLFIYSIFMSINLIDSVILKNGSIIIKKKFKHYHLKNIIFINIIKIGLIKVIIIRIILNEKKKFTGYYFYQRQSHDRFIDLLQRQNFRCRIKTI
jgi:hypothetical protein